MFNLYVKVQVILFMKAIELDEWHYIFIGMLVDFIVQGATWSLFGHCDEWCGR